jgi:hypothetical protein
LGLSVGFSWASSFAESCLEAGCLEGGCCCFVSALWAAPLHRNLVGTGNLFRLFKRPSRHAKPECLSRQRFGGFFCEEFAFEASPKSPLTCPTPERPYRNSIHIPLSSPPPKGRIETRPISFSAGSVSQGCFLDGGFLEGGCLEGRFAGQVLGPT